MGNPAHLEELLKGVTHWNAWRKEQGDDFRPDFSEMNIRQAFIDAGVISAEQRVPLGEADLGEAVLWGAKLGAADLGGANLWGAILRRADLGEADLWGADIRTFSVSLEVSTNDGVTPEDSIYLTNISVTLNLTQNQLNEMIGDSETVIPDHLERPAHWGVFEGGEEDAPDEVYPDGARIAQQTVTETDTGTEPEPQSAKRKLTQHVELLLTTLPAASASADDLAARLRLAGQTYDQELGANGSDESRTLDKMAAAFASLGAKLKEFEDKPDRNEIIEELRREIEEKEKQIAELTAALCAQPSAAKQILIGALIGAGGVGLVNGAGYLLGPSGAETVQGLWNLITGGGTVPPPPPPSLPPTTTL